MILYPSVDKLLERVDSRYKLIALGAKRAHELEQGGLPTLSHFDSVKPIMLIKKPVRYEPAFLFIVPFVFAFY